MRRNQRLSLSEQTAMLDLIKDLAVEKITLEQREAVFRIASHPADEELMLRAAILLSGWYPKIAPDDPDFARRTHIIMLRDLREKRKMLAHPSCSWLVMTHLREENLAHIPWQSTEEVAGAAECFYGFCDGNLTADESHRRVRDLVKYAGIHFVRQGKYEKAFQLLGRVPVPSSVMDADLFRLRNTLILYEQRRSRRVRQLLGLTLIFVIVFIWGVSPFLFLWLENPVRAAAGQPALGFTDGLYWSSITAATVGYGDLVPMSAGGKLLAIFDSLLGMTVMGVLAGVILAVVTPRQLP